MNRKPLIWVLLLLLLPFAAVSPVGAQPTLFPARTLITDDNPTALATGDLDGDGKPDLVTTSNLKNTISVFLNRGGGAFSTRQDYPLSLPGYGVQIADFNGDGRNDILVLKENFSIRVLSILYNTGGGHFAPEQQDPNTFSGRIYQVAVSDLNADGKPDVVLLSQDFLNNVVIVLLGNGSGTFAPRRIYPLDSPRSLAIADFNGDGKPDLAVANDYPNQVSILLNQGDGTFAPRQNYPTGNDCFSLQAADFNGDGKPDLVMTIAGYAVSVLMNNGDGTFAPRQDYPTAANTDSLVNFQWVVPIDLNHDGKPDLIASNTASNVRSGDLIVFLNQGDGTFVRQQDYWAEAPSNGAVIGDFDGDGNPDIVTWSNNNSTLVVTTGKGDGTLRTRILYAVGSSPTALVARDFNGDGILDLAATNYNSETVSILLGKPDGTFAAKTDYPIGSRCDFQMVIGDFNGDGKPDLAICGENNDRAVNVLLNRGDGTFAPKVDYPAGFYPSMIAAGDLDGDGKLDLITVSRYGSGMSILRGNSDGTFAAARDYSLGFRPYDVKCSDLNGDGKLDLVMTSPDTNGIRVFLNLGHFVFAPPVTYPTGLYCYSIAVGDLDGDGKLDLAATNGYPQSISVWRGRGDGTFDERMDYSADLGPENVLLADVDGNGKLDIVCTNNGNSVGILLSQGDGTFGQVTNYTAGLNPSAVVAGDFNRDGRLDLATVGGFDDSVNVLFNLGARARVSGTLLLEGISPNAPAQTFTFVFRSAGQPDAIQSAMILPNGAFSLLVPKRDGILHVSGAKYLAKNRAVNASRGEVLGVTIPMRTGDVNSDNGIDIRDILVLLVHYNRSTPGAGYLEAADFDGDGSNDISDLLLLVGNYNQMGDI